MGHDRVSIVINNSAPAFDSGFRCCVIARSVTEDTAAATLIQSRMLYYSVSKAVGKGVRNFYRQVRDACNGDASPFLHFQRTHSVTALSGT